MSRKGNKMAKMPSWYQMRLSELRRVFTMYISFWQLKAQPLDPGSFGFCWRLVRRWYQCPTFSYSQDSVILGAKIRGCMWGTGGFNLLLNVPLCPSEIPRTALVDTETGNGANFWQKKPGLTRTVTSQRQGTVHPDLSYPGLALLWAGASPNQATAWYRRCVF